MSRRARASASPHVLKEEVRCFDRECEQLLLSAPGKFVLIRGDAVTGVFDTEEAAVAAGYAAFGPVPFLVRQLLAEPERVFLDLHEERA